MSSLFHSYTRYGSDRVGIEYEVLVCEWATDNVHLVAHNKCYEHFLVPSDDVSILGRVVRVRVTSVGKFYMKAELVREQRTEMTACAGQLYNWSRHSVGAFLRQMSGDCVHHIQSISNAFAGAVVSVVIALLFYFVLSLY